MVSRLLTYDFRMRLTGPLLPPGVFVWDKAIQNFRLGGIEPIGVGNELVPIFEQPQALLLLFAISTFVVSEAAKVGTTTTTTLRQ